MVRILTSMFIFSNLFLRSQNCTNSNTMGATLTQQLLPLPEHMSSPPVCSGVRVDWSLDFCVVFCRSLLVFLFFSLLVIVLSVLRFTASDYPFGILDLRLLITPFGILDLRLLITPFGIFKLQTFPNINNQYNKYKSIMVSIKFKSKTYHRVWTVQSSNRIIVKIDVPIPHI